jgi:hypothetical protein
MTWEKYKQLHSDWVSNSCLWSGYKEKRQRDIDGSGGGFGTLETPQLAEQFSQKDPETQASRAQAPKITKDEQKKEDTDDFYQDQSLMLLAQTCFDTSKSMYPLSGPYFPITSSSGSLCSFLSTQGVSWMNAGYLQPSFVPQSSSDESQPKISITDLLN